MKVICRLCSVRDLSTGRHCLLIDMQSPFYLKYRIIYLPLTTEAFTVVISKLEVKPQGSGSAMTLVPVFIL